jgi:hypothetical protein
VCRTAVDADLGAEVLGIGGNGQHGIRCGLEQEIVDHGLVLVGDSSDLGGQREDDVKIGNLQHLGLATTVFDIAGSPR